MKIYIFIVTLYFYSTLAFSQNTIKKNEVFAELGGNGLLGSINYTRQLGKKPGLGIRAGVGLWGDPTFVTFPLGLNYLINILGSHSYLDLGLGATFSKANVHFFYPKLNEGYVEKKPFAYFIPSAGVRIYTTKDFVWHLNATPVTTEFGMMPYVGFGFGKRF